MKDQRCEKAMNFYLLATKLKNKIRSGWDEKHWHVTSDRVESVAEHIYGTCILAISIDSEFKFDIDLNKVLKMLVIHELGEVIIGDITPFEKITREEKEKIEHEAFVKIVGDLIKKEELISLIEEFNKRETKEAKFAYYCDKLEADLQCKVYQDEGYQKTIEEHKTRVVYQDERIKRIVDNGAKNVFEVWYEADKNIFKDSKEFTSIFNYIKETNTNKK